MAVLASIANGNLTDASTWALIDSTSYRDSEASTSNSSTSYTYSDTFTPGAITIDGFALKLSRSSAIAGTFTAGLFENTGSVLVAGTEITLSSTDLSDSMTGISASSEVGWVFFKASAPVTLTAATAYKIGIKSTAGGLVSMHRAGGGSTQYSRFLRTTTTQAPVAGDTMHIVAERTGSGVYTGFTVTMNSTATTDYGSGTADIAALTVGGQTTLVFGNASATNYYLKLSGDLVVYGQGTLTIGTVANPIPRDSTVVLEFDNVADGDVGLSVRSNATCTIQGLSRTSGKDIVACKLNTDEAVGQTTLGVDTDTGWLSGDEVIIAKTNRASGLQTETRILNGDAGASSIDITAGLTYSHSGTAPTQAHIINLTRNIKIRSASATAMSFASFEAASIVDIDWAEFYYLGSVSSTEERGLSLSTSSSGSFSMHYSTVHDCENYMLSLSNSWSDNITVDHCGFAKMLNSSNNPIYIAQATGDSIVFTNNYFLGLQSAAGSASFPGGVIVLEDVGLTFSNNVLADTTLGKGIRLKEANTALGEFSGNEVYGIHSNDAIYVESAGLSGEISSLKLWHSGTIGLSLNASVNDLTINSSTIFGNVTNVQFGSSGYNNVVFNTCVIAGGTSGSSTTGISFLGGGNATGIVFNECELGIADTGLTTHTSDISLATNTSVDALFSDCLFGSATLIANPGNMTLGSSVRFFRLNQVEDTHYFYKRNGIGQSTGTGLTDTTVRTADSLALRLAPTNSATGLSFEFKILARANSAVSIIGFLKKNATFGTDDLVVDLYLPGSLTSDATQTMADDTEWNVFNLYANYTGDASLYARVVITAKSATAGAYAYLDDIYNGTNSITGLDVWDQGQPSPIMFEQLGDAAAVWAISTATLTTAGTTGKTLVDAKKKASLAAIS